MVFADKEYTFQNLWLALKSSRKWILASALIAAMGAGLLCTDKNLWRQDSAACFGIKPDIPVCQVFSIFCLSTPRGQKNRAAY